MRLYVNIILFLLALEVMLVTRSNSQAEKPGCLQSERGSVRLTGLNSSYAGYVQVCRNGRWTPVSFEGDEEWTKKNSIVTCRELGFLGSVRILNQDPKLTPHGSLTTSGSNSLSPWQYYSVECTGLEERLVDCTWSIESDNMGHKDVVVLCKEDPADGDLTLVGVNGKDNEGIVEIYSSVKTYKWSPICSNEWDDADADVTCRQLGFKGGYSTHYSDGDEVRFKNLPRKRFSHYNCSGTENRLSDCDHVGPYPYMCYSDYYAGVVCAKQGEDNTILDLNIALLAFMIVISLLLIIILLLILRCTLLKFNRKSSSSNRNRVSENEENTTNRVRNGNVIRTQLDSEMPYAPPIAPPSYQDTLLADQRVQTSDVNSSEVGTGSEEGDEAGSISSLNRLLTSEREQQNIAS